MTSICTSCGETVEVESEASDPTLHKSACHDWYLVNGIGNNDPIEPDYDNRFDLILKIRKHPGLADYFYGATDLIDKLHEYTYDDLRTVLWELDNLNLINALIKFKFPYRPCGLNADWSCLAFHLGPSTRPNMVSGDFYLIHMESTDGWAIARRVFDEETDEVEMVRDNFEVGFTIEKAVRIAAQIRDRGWNYRFDSPE